MFYSFRLSIRTRTLGQRHVSWNAVCSTINHTPTWSRRWLSTLYGPFPANTWPSGEIRMLFRVPVRIETGWRCVIRYRRNRRNRRYNSLETNVTRYSRGGKGAWEKKGGEENMRLEINESGRCGRLRCWVNIEPAYRSLRRTVDPLSLVLLNPPSSTPAPPASDAVNRWDPPVIRRSDGCISTSVGCRLGAIKYVQSIQWDEWWSALLQRSRGNGRRREVGRTSLPVDRVHHGVKIFHSTSDTVRAEHVGYLYNGHKINFLMRHSASESHLCKLFVEKTQSGKLFYFESVDSHFILDDLITGVIGLLLWVTFFHHRVIDTHTHAYIYTNKQKNKHKIWLSSWLYSFKFI